MKRSYLSALVVAGGLLFSHAAFSAITLSQRDWQADSYQTFSPEGYLAATTLANIEISAVGNTQKMADASAIDPATGDTVKVPVFRFPVTKSTVNLFVDRHLSDTATGWVTRSGLKFTRRTTGRIKSEFSVVLANFKTDFKNGIQYADIITSTGTVKDVAAFTFQVDERVYADLKRVDKHLRIVAKGSISKMVMTPKTIQLMGDALQLTDVLRGPMVTMDWGRVDVDVTNAKRSPKTNDTPLQASDVGL